MSSENTPEVRIFHLLPCSRPPWLDGNAASPRAHLLPAEGSTAGTAFSTSHSMCEQPGKDLFTGFLSATTARRFGLSAQRTESGKNVKIQHKAAGDGCMGVDTKQILGRNSWL